MDNRLKDPYSRTPLKDPRSSSERGYYSQHYLQSSIPESSGSMAVRINRALRDKRTVRPGQGRWVEYILPDMRRVYVESNIRKMYLGRMDDAQITARVIVKAGGTEYTNSLEGLILMGMAQVSGDLVDVVRTADLVGLSVTDPDTRSIRSISGNTPLVREKMASLAKMASDAATTGDNKIVHEGGKAYGVSKVLVPAARMKEHEELLKSPKSDGRTHLEARFDRQGRPIMHSKTLLGDAKDHKIEKVPRSKVVWRADGSVSSSTPLVREKMASLASKAMRKEADYVDSDKGSREVKYALLDMARQGSMESTPVRDKAPRKTVRNFVLERYQDGGTYLDKWTLTQTGKTEATLKRTGMLTVEEPPKMSKRADHLNADQSTRSVYYMLQEMAAGRPGKGNPVAVGRDNKIVLTERYVDGKPIFDRWRATRRDRDTLVIRHAGVMRVE